MLPEDSILDKYIKQHREEIEADKFETRQFKKEELAATQSLEELIQAVRETSDTTADEELGEESSIDVTDTNSSDFVLPPLEEKSQKIEPLVVIKEGVDEDDEVQEDDTVFTVESYCYRARNRSRFYKETSDDHRFSTDCNCYLIGELFCLPSNLTFKPRDTIFTISFNRPSYANSITRV